MSEIEKESVVEETNQTITQSPKGKKHKKNLQNLDRNIIFGVYFVLAVLFSCYCLWPVLWTVGNSLKTQEEYVTNIMGWPQAWNFRIYLDTFVGFSVGAVGFLEMALNSIWLAFGKQILEVVASAMVAYPLARYNFPGKEFFYGIIVFRITIPIIGGGAAAYKLMRAMGMINNPLLYALQWFSGFDMTALIMYGYFKNISKEYSEAAFMDGASKLTTLVKVVMPQAWPCVLAMYVSAVMGCWNNYSDSMLYLTRYPNLAMGIYSLEASAMFLPGGMPMYFAGIIISAIVPLLLFIGGQKTMLENMSVGGLKG